MSIFESFKNVIQLLESENINYMVVGSVASIVYGEPRMTKDMDIVIQISSLEITKVLKLFDNPRFYCPPAEILIDEINNQGQFNILDHSTFLKFDFILKKNNPHSIEEFNRKEKITLFDLFEAFVATPEDIIIKKLMYYKEGRSEKHLMDIKGILANTELDKPYLEQWIRKLSLELEWGLI